MNEKSEGKPSCWRLSDTVLRKLKSSNFESEHLMKENIPIDRGSWNSGKYKTIAPKPHSYSENSSDGITSQSPLKSQNINQRRLCFSEDKNLFRRKVAAFTRPFTGTTFRIGPASSTEKKDVSLSKDKRIKEKKYELKSKARKRLLDISDSKKQIHLQITGSSCTSSPDGKFMKLHEDIAISTDNASFNFVGNSAGNKSKMETFRDHPDYPFSMTNNLPSDKSSNAGESLSESKKDLSSNSIQACEGNPQKSINDHETSSNTIEEADQHPFTFIHEKGNDSKKNFGGQNTKECDDVFDALRRDSQSSYDILSQYTDSESYDLSCLDTLEFDDEIP